VLHSHSRRHGFHTKVVIRIGRLQFVDKHDRIRTSQELDLEFFNRVRQEYLRRASNDPQRFVLIDSSLSIMVIQEQLKARIASM